MHVRCVFNRGHRRAYVRLSTLTQTIPLLSILVPNPSHPRLPRAVIFLLFYAMQSAARMDTSQAAFLPALSHFIHSTELIQGVPAGVSNSVFDVFFPVDCKEET